MSRDTDIAEALYFAHEASIRNKIDTQVILQLMVKKSLVTADEVAEMREYISKQPMYKLMLDSLSNTKNSIDSSKEFENAFSKVLKGTATKEDRDKALKYFDK